MELVRMEAEEFLRGSFLEKAPLVAVSAKNWSRTWRTEKALTDAAADSSAKECSAILPAAIDRAFAMKGFGSVVTGTLISEALARR